MKSTSDPTDINGTSKPTLLENGSANKCYYICGIMNYTESETD